MVIFLDTAGHVVNRKRVQRLRRRRGLAGMAPGPNTSRPHPEPFVPPLDQTPTFPTMVLVGIFVTVEATRTVKFAKSEPRIGVAQAGVVAHNAVIPANTRTDNDLCGPGLH